MSNGPLPTVLTFLSSLPSHAPGSKVRFLGCVTAYHIPTKTLTLEHTYYPASLSSKQDAVALVDVGLLLEGLKREDTVVGAWVNIIGYVENVKSPKQQKSVDIRGHDGRKDIVEVNVQAIMLWSAGGVKLGEYEKAMEGRLKSDKRI